MTRDDAEHEPKDRVLCWKKCALSARIGKNAALLWNEKPRHGAGPVID